LLPAPPRSVDGRSAQLSLVGCSPQARSGYSWYQCFM
jgi:hypothetical protein